MIQSLTTLRRNLTGPRPQVPLTITSGATRLIDRAQWAADTDGDGKNYDR